MAEELRPCKCGEEEKLIVCADGIYGHIFDAKLVLCEACGHTGQSAKGEQGAIQAWNRRSKDEEKLYNF